MPEPAGPLEIHLCIDVTDGNAFRCSFEETGLIIREFCEAAEDCEKVLKPALENPEPFPGLPCSRRAVRIPAYRLPGKKELPSLPLRRLEAPVRNKRCGRGGKD